MSNVTSRREQTEEKRNFPRKVILEETRSFVCNSEYPHHSQRHTRSQQKRAALSSHSLCYAPARTEMRTFLKQTLTPEGSFSLFVLRTRTENSDFGLTVISFFPQQSRSRNFFLAFFFTLHVISRRTVTFSPAEKH